MQQPVDERAAEGVAGAEAVDDLDRHRRDLDDARRACARARRPGPRLTIATSTPSSSSAADASCGSRVPTATATSSRLPTATVACASASRAQRAGLGLVGPEHRPVVEVVDGDRVAAVARLAARPASPRGSARRDRPVPVVQNTRAARIASRSSSSTASVMSGAVGSR